MREWHFGQCYHKLDVFNFLMFYPSQVGSKNLNDYKNCKLYSYYKPGWLQTLQHQNLTRSKYCIFRGECRRSQSIKSSFYKLSIIVEKTSKIGCYCAYMAGMRETCNHV